MTWPGCERWERRWPGKNLPLSRRLVNGAVAVGQAA